MTATTLTLSSRFVFPVEGPPIPGGRVSIRAGRIESISQANGPSPDLDLGNFAIVPGFVNAHTHLEIDRLPDLGGSDEIDWLTRVVAWRRSQGVGESFAEIASRNAKASIESGVTLVGDVTTAGASWPALAAAPTRGVVFSEVVGLKRARGLQTSQEAWDFLATIKPEHQVAANCRPGLSPHAPYSTAEWLYHKSVSSRLPLSTHLAELPEELELLQSRSGRLREFLADLGAWDEDWSPVGPSPADYVRKKGLKNADWLVAHGTYFDEDEFWRFKPGASPKSHRVAIAYCPRTHARFGHRPHPYRTMLERGIVVCLGTDSLASSPSLSVFDEMRFLFQQDQGVSGQLLLTMGTLFGAWGLRAETICGSLKPGKSADLAIIALPNRDDPDPYKLLLDSDLGVVASMFEGKFTSGPWRSEPGVGSRE